MQPNTRAANLAAPSWLSAQRPTDECPLRTTTHMPREATQNTYRYRRKAAVLGRLAILSDASDIAKALAASLAAPSSVELWPGEAKPRRRTIHTPLSGLHQTKRYLDLVFIGRRKHGPTPPQQLEPGQDTKQVNC